MKIRNGFVSNSSSSSFLISKKYLTDEQILNILDYVNNSQGDAWNVIDIGDEISGWTVMDNGDMFDYLKEIEIDMNIVNWDYD